MKLLTILGTRPEIIRLSVIIQKLNSMGVENVVVYTNQNFMPNLSTLFFNELGFQPSIRFAAGDMFATFDQVLHEEKPDRVLVLGDTYSGLLAVLCSKHNIPVYHMEAGNRCYDETVPEERNRKIIDACATINMPYTRNSYDNLINEGWSKNRVFRIGNPICEVINFYQDKIDESDILERLKVDPYDYVLCTFHRAENTNRVRRLYNIVKAINKISKQKRVIVSIHPRTIDKIPIGAINTDNVTVLEAFGFFDFVKLESKAYCTITDSGTVPEESALFGIPCVVMRETTERQELIENGCMILAGTDSQSIIRAFDMVEAMRQNVPEVPDEYLSIDVSDRVIKILLGK